MKTKNKIITICLAFVMVVGILFAGSASTVSAASDPANAPADWAFTAESVELNDAILEAYPAIDTNNDGFISISEANMMTGAIDIINKNIGGTIDGIENFISISSLNLGNNQLTGEIPLNIGNMTSLAGLYLHGNKINGAIPDSIGNLASLNNLFLRNNLLSGAIPSSFGNLANLTYITMNDNDLTGEIPSEIGNLTNLTTLGLANNNLSGNIPISVFNLPNLMNVNFSYNSNLTGNPATGFASNTVLYDLDIRGTNLIQASPEIATLGYTVGAFKYDNLAKELLADSKTTLADGVTQATIDKAQESADFITNPTAKQQWQEDIDLAQSMLNAKNKVDTLLTTDGANLKDGVDKAKVDEAQDAVNKLPAGDLKDDLQAKIDTANNLLDAKNKTEGLVNPDGSLGAGVDQNKINEAQKAVDKLPDGATKTELQKIINHAQKLLNAKNSTNESTKPVVLGGDTTNKIAVSTGDTTKIATAYAMLGISLLGIIVSIGRRKEQR